MSTKGGYVLSDGHPIIPYPHSKISTVQNSLGYLSFSAPYIDIKNTLQPQRKKKKKGRPKLATMEQNFNLEFELPQSTSYLSFQALNKPTVSFDAI